MKRIPNTPPASLSRLGIALTMLLSFPNAHALDGKGTVKASFESGWAAYEVVTSGDDIDAVDVPGYGTTMTKYSFDGLGAWVTGNTLRVYVNHEMTDSSISRVDLDMAAFQQSVSSLLNGGSPAFPASVVTQIGLAYDTINGGSSSFSRFCSGGVHLPNAFGEGMGFADALYMTGEEVDGGRAYALDCATSTLWEIAAFEDGTSNRWENFAPIDTGNTTHVAVALWSDFSSGDDQLMIYVGKKGIDANEDGNVDFLERNGLRGGNIYYFDPMAGVPDGLSDGVEEYFLTTVRADGELEGKLEDIHTNPANGKQLVFSAQNNGLYLMDVAIQFDGSGDVVPGASTVSISNLLTDDNSVSTFDDPDNLAWSPSGHIYVQEDGSNAGSPAHEIWSLSPSDPAGTLTKVGQGVTETSGIIDVSELAGFPHNTVFLFSVMGGSGTSQLVTLVNREACPAFSPGVQVGSVTDSRLDEISGLAVSTLNPGVLWVHEDNNNDAEIYALGTDGAVLGTYTLSGATNNDWEDMAIGRDPVSGVDYLYIADVGDNNAYPLSGRSNLTIYRVPEPDRSVDPTGTLLGVEVFPVNYPDTQYDCETLLVDPLSGDIVMVTRDRDNKGLAHVFSYPFASQTPGVAFTLERKTSLAYSIEIKGGDVSRAGDQVILRTSINGGAADGLFWNRPPGTPLWEVFDDPYCLVPLAAEVQGEAVSFNAMGTGYYTISEEGGGEFSPVPVYFYGGSDNHPPVADSQNLVTNEDVHLDITLKATDGDGDPLTYVVVRGPANGSLSGTGANRTYTPKLNYNGEDSFTFAANDGTATSDEATITIMVNPVNDAPLANAGPDQWVFENALVSLNGTGSFDPDGDPISYTWTQVDGPAVELSATIAAEPSFLAPAVSQDTTLVFSLVVSDATSSSAPDTVSVMVSQLSYDAFVSQEPTVISGTVNGSIDNTMDSDGQVQTVTEVNSGSKARKRLEVEYLLQTIAPPASITSLKLNLVHAWTDQDSPSESLEAFVWNTSGPGGWEEISSTLLGSGVTDLSGSPGSPNVYVDGSQSIRVLFRDSAEIPREKADTLSIDSLWANIEVGTPDTEPPAAPTGLVLVGDPLEFQVNLDWDDNAEDDLLGYFVYRSDTEFGTYTALNLYPNMDPIPGSDIQDATVNAGTTYYYAVTAVDVSGNESDPNTSDPSTPPLAATTTDLPPAAPVNVTATAGNQRVTVDWNDNMEPDLAGYNVYRSGTAGGPYTLVNTSSLIVGNGVVDDTGLVNGIPYYYVVTAVDIGGAGKESDLSIEVSATPSAQPSLHVEGVTVQATQKGKNWKGDAYVTIVDQEGAPLAGAAVTGEWSFDGQPNSTGTVLTDANGIAVLTSSPEKANSGAFQFEVTGVVLVGYTDITDYGDTSVTTATVTFP